MQYFINIFKIYLILRHLFDKLIIFKWGERIWIKWSFTRNLVTSLSSPIFKNKILQRYWRYNLLNPLSLQRFLWLMDKTQLIEVMQYSLQYFLPCATFITIWIFNGVFFDYIRSNRLSQAGTSSSWISLNWINFPRFINKKYIILHISRLIFIS